MSAPAPESTHESPSPVRMTSSPLPVNTTAVLVKALALGVLGRGARAAGEADGQVARVAATVEHDGLDRRRPVSENDSVRPMPRTSTAGLVRVTPARRCTPGTCRIAQVSSLFLASHAALPRGPAPPNLPAKTYEDTAVGAAQPGRRRGAVGLEAEVEQLDVDQREVEAHRERAEADHDEHLDVERELSPDVEQADRVVGHGRAELEQPELAVVRWGRSSRSRRSA